MAGLTPVTDANFHEVMGAPAAVVDFWAPWCGACRTLAPVMERLAGEYEGRALFVGANVDKEQRIAAEHKVMALPTLLFLRNGRVVNRIEGALPHAKLAAVVDAMLAAP